MMVSDDVAVQARQAQMLIGCGRPSHRTIWPPTYHLMSIFDLTPVCSKSVVEKSRSGNAR